MFLEVEFEWTVLVQPDAMKSSAHIQKAVIVALLKDFNDVKCTARHGYHVSVTTLESIGEGRLWERRACAAFPVRFRCILFNVFKFERVLAVVTEVVSGGISAQCGCIETLFIAQKFFAGEYELVSTEVDGLEVSKWRHCIDGTLIKKGDVIRVKILGTKWEASDRRLSVVGTLVGVDDRWQKPTPKANVGSESSRQGAGDGLWGDPLPTEHDVEASGWGDPMTNEEEHGGWA